MSVQILGVLVLLVFYSLFFVVGSLAGRRLRKGQFDDFLVAGRSLPLLVGVFTMIATWVGGGYLNGTAEAVYDRARGLVWAQAPWGYALSLILGGIFFAGKMRSLGFRTLLDLFDLRYGKRFAAGLFFPALLGEVFWSSAILAALGTALATILGVDYTTAVLISTLVAIGYTLIGGLRSVAYTDLLQLALIIVGLGISVPFLLNGLGGLGVLIESYKSHFGSAAIPVPTNSAWSIAGGWGWLWMDWALLLVFGGIPWQVYFQRVLACRSSESAVRLSIYAGIGCLLIAVPAGLVGAVGSVVDWSQIDAGPPEPSSLVLPWVLLHLTPPLIGILGLSAIAAAVMSSVDSSILSASSMFTWNVYRPFAKGGRDERKLTTIMRGTVLLVGLLAALLALQVQSVYTLWALCADIVYVVLFPQLVMALYCSKVNRFGAFAGACIGLFLRIGGGEPGLGLSGFLPYPMENPEYGVVFPFRTFSMLCGLFSIWAVSSLTVRWDPFAPKATNGKAQDNAVDR